MVLGFSPLVFFFFKKGIECDWTLGTSSYWLGIICVLKTVSTVC